MNGSYYEPLVIAITIVFNDIGGNRGVANRSICSSAWPLLPAPLGRSRGSEGAHREKVRRGEDVGRVGVTEKVRKGRLCGVGCVERNDREKTLSP
jgi:hypothetical protein